jgi:VanZ family protein
MILERRVTHQTSLSRVLRPSPLYVVRTAFAALLAFTLFKALAPGGGPPAGFVDKLQHAFAFYLLALTATAAAPRSSLVPLACGLAFVGGLIEVLQALPAIGRSCDFDDWLADMVGVGLAFAPLVVARWREALSA